jgi:hypothetical protein
MRDWVFQQLDNFYRAHRAGLLKETIDPENGDATILELLDSSDRSRREQGLDILRLLVSRLLGPEIGNRIQWKRNRGHPKGQPPSEPPKGLARRPIDVYYDYRSQMHMAKRAVPIIQKSWREHYGRSRRLRGDGPDAYEIAAAYFDKKDVDVRRKPSGRRKKELRAK